MIRQRKIEQKHLEVELEHRFLFPDNSHPLPAVLLIHEYTGLNDVILKHGHRLASAGFAVLAADFYGIHKRPQNIEQARTTHRIYRNDRLLMRKRAEACFQTLTDQPEVNSREIIVLGLSFGGGCALELARTGAMLNGAVSIYGYLDTSHPAQTNDIRCSILSLHVENDPVVSAEHALQFEQEMTAAHVDWEMIRIENAKHGFANPLDDGFNPKTAEWMWEKVIKWIKKP